MRQQSKKILTIKDVPGLADVFKEKMEALRDKYANIDWKAEIKKMEKRHAENVYKQWRIKQLEESGSEFDKRIIMQIAIDDTKKLINTYIRKKKELDFEGRAMCTELIRVLKLSLKRFQDELNNGKAVNDYKQTLWFKVGLLFANGEMDKLLSKHQNNFTAIARELGKKNYRPYISETFANTNNSDKNIFSNPSKVMKIFNHCKTNGSPVTDKFKGLIPQE